MNIFRAVRTRVDRIISDLHSKGHLATIETPYAVEVPHNPNHGDLAINAALVLCKSAVGEYRAPRVLAKAIADALNEAFYIKRTDIAGQGFINILLTEDVRLDILRQAAHGHGGYARQKALQGRYVNIEYVSANPTGPLHVGHARGAILGDAIANLLQFVGRDVKREYYVNDAGKQIDTLARSAYFRYLQALGEDIAEQPDEFYPGDYLIPVGQGMAEHYGRSLVGKSEDIWLSIIGERVAIVMLDLIKDDLKAIGIHHDVFFSERCLVYSGETAPKGVMAHRASMTENAVQETIHLLRNEGLVYDGLPPDWKYGNGESTSGKTMTLFRSTKFGDDRDRVVIRDDGTHTYFANDLTYHLDKIARGYKTLINVWGADHDGYISRMKAAVAALSKENVELEIVICQHVHLVGNSQKLAMSKRKGDYVTMREVIDDVGADALRMTMLFMKPNKTMDFNRDAVLAKSKENPVFYVQYAYARCKSVQTKAIEECEIDLDNTFDITLLSHPFEQTIFRRIMAFPKVVCSAAEAREPHLVAHYLYDLAGELHALWQAPGYVIIDGQNIPLTTARAFLCRAVSSVLNIGLVQILGVVAPERMARVDKIEA